MNVANVLFARKVVELWLLALMEADRMEMEVGPNMGF